MKSRRIVRVESRGGKYVEVLPDGTTRPLKTGKSDLARLATMTDEEIIAAARADPDAAQPRTEAQLKRARRILQELRTNRVDRNRIELVANKIVAPLERIERENFPAARAAVGEFRKALDAKDQSLADQLGAARTEGAKAKTQVRKLIAELTNVMASMQKLIDVNQLITMLRKIEEEEQKQYDLIRQKEDWRDVVGTPSVPGSGVMPHLVMEGNPVFRWASFAMAKVGQQALDRAGIGVDDLDVFVPHQANMRIIDAMARSMKLPEHVRIARDIAEQGNTSAASIPLALHRMVEEGEARSGDTALLIAFGAGLAYAAQVVTVP